MSVLIDLTESECLQLAAYLDERIVEYKSRNDCRYDDTIVWLQHLSGELRLCLKYYEEE
jgi:hypothetical protein